MEMNGWKKYSMIAGAFAVTLGIMASWQSMDFMPRWAWNSELQVVAEQVASNTRLILGQEWERLKAKIYDLRDQLARNPSNRDLHEDLARAEQQLREVEQGLAQ